ncbi:hypothetical protein THAOC_03714 [Thalassiosira oceanica]|uniref:RING-type domain-containing protein n=1 Tax=Thalassiosira oceanica TaxID=159749 RepID=K0T744_THAOC|nr:hypothetical protein THAOC_03714 [Thalassiosira oceanica]|eukprot:EJK74598.1 hypothetical protein THAOC_03714 [Thalassiosira oceanica]
MDDRSSASPPPLGDASTLLQTSTSRRNVVANQSLAARREAAQLDQDRGPNWDRVPRWRTSRSRPSLMLAYDHERRWETRETESFTAGESGRSSFFPPPWMRPALTGTQDVRERQLEALESSYNHPIAPPVRRGQVDPFHDRRFILDTPIGLSFARQQRSRPSRYMTEYGNEIDRGFRDSDDEVMCQDRRLAIELALHGSDESSSDDDDFLLDEGEAEANAVTVSLSHTSPPSSLDLSSDGRVTSESISTQSPASHSPAAEQEAEVSVPRQAAFKSERQLPIGKPKDCDDSTPLKTSGDEKTPTSCVICLEKPSQESLASIDGCEHLFCFDCIAHWAEHENSCPLCKNRFFKIVRLQQSKKRKMGDCKDTQNTKRVKQKDQRSDLQSSLDNVAGMFEFVRQSLAAARAQAGEPSSQRTREVATFHSRRVEYEEFRRSQFNRMRESPAGRATTNAPLFGFADPSSRRGMQMPSESLFEADNDDDEEDELEEDFFMSPSSYFQRLYRELESASAANRGRFIYNAANTAAAASARRRQQMERLRISEVDERLRARYSSASSAHARSGGIHSTASSTTAGGPARPSGQTSLRSSTNASAPATNPYISQMRYYNHSRVANANSGDTQNDQLSCSTATRTRTM